MVPPGDQGTPLPGGLPLAVTPVTYVTLPSEGNRNRWGEGAISKRGTSVTSEHQRVVLGPVVAATTNYRDWLVVKYRKVLSSNENLILNRAYRTELAPGDEQLQMLHGHVGTARFACNWGLRWVTNIIEYNQLPHKRLKLPSAMDLHRELNGLKGTKYPWMYEFSKCAPQERCVI